jgi:6-phosphofructokinase 1
VEDDERILFDVYLSTLKKQLSKGIEPQTFEMAGPREKIYFQPSKTRAAIVTCGGLCPGINNVIRSLVMHLYYRYGVKKILGVRYGYQGFINSFGHDFVEITPEWAHDLHDKGGSILASSRGDQDITAIVDTLERQNINILFTIGGDGTLRGAAEIAEEIRSRDLKISTIGIPKTIDNDINCVAKTFGFESAVSQAAIAIKGAHVEAKGAPYGVGIVKLMGRHSGYIAASAALACREVNYVLVPEVSFTLKGENGLYVNLEKRLRERGHAVIVVAEGAGQEFFEGDGAKDASGNLRLKDIGLYLRDEIKEHFKMVDLPVNVKYIDPSYIIRSTPANAADAIYCGMLAENAVHAAMAGKTNMIVGSWNDRFVHVPIRCAVAQRKVIDPESPFWLSVLESTGQPISMK